MQNANQISINLPIEINETSTTKFDFGFSLLAVFCVMDVVFIVSKIFELLSPKEVSLISDSNQLASSCLAVLMTLQVVRHPALDAKIRRSWKILAIAYFTYGIGNLFWFYHSSMLNEKPFPTMADVGYWGFYPLMFWALLSFAAAQNNRTDRTKLLMDIGIVMLGGITVVWHFIIQPTLANITDGGLIPIFLNLSYTIGDLVLMLGVATILMSQVDGNHRKTLYLIIVGLISMSIADYGFAYLTLQNTYYSGHWIDTFFQTSSLAFAIASHYQYKQLCKPIEAQNAVENETNSAHSFSWLPYLAIGLGCTMLLIETQPYWGNSLGIIVFTSLGITVLVVARQITAVKENVRLLKAQARQQSESRLAALVQNSSDLITILDLDDTIRYESPSLKNVLGYEVEELVGKKSAELMHPQDSNEHWQIIEQLVAEPGSIISKELRFKHKNGSWHVLETVSRRIDDEANDLSGILVNSRDITGRKQDEEKLHLYNRKLEESNRELQDFAYVSSHDLQEPLRKVQAFGDRLSRKYSEKLGEEGKDYIFRMKTAAERMQILINGLLEFSRISSKAKPFAPTDLNQICHEVISDLEISIEQANATVIVDNLPEIEADSLQIRQILQNLIGNSLKFQKSETPPIIKIYAKPFKPSDATFDFCVEDNGIGFDEKYLDRIFTVFQRLHARDNYEGSGIGLSVCKKIVERHNGTITAQSTEGEGATFIVTLPFKNSTSIVESQISVAS